MSWHLASMLQDAVADLARLNPEPGPYPQRLYDRFLGWVKPRLDITRTRLGAGTGGNRSRSRAEPLALPVCALGERCHVLRWLRDGDPG